MTFRVGRSQRLTCVLRIAVLILGIPITASAGTEENFAVLASSTVNNIGATSVTGDLGVAPGSAITGFPPGVVAGVIHSNDAVAIQAQLDLATTYNSGAALPCTADLSGQDLGGLVLTPGVYCFASTATQSGNLTLNFQGNPNAVFLFKTAAAFITTPGTSVLLVNNGGSSCPPNVTWLVGSSATLGTNSNFVGDVLAVNSITLGGGATVAGSTLARFGAVTMDTNVIARCASAALVTAVPTLSEWAMILLGLALAAGAALHIQRRRLVPV